MPFALPFGLEWRSLIVILALVAVFPLVAGYIVLLERKVMADIQSRLGPMRVGPYGLLQPIADAVKLLLKEDIIPSQADKWVFWVSPIIPVVTGLVAFSVVPFSDTIYVTDTNIGLLFILAVSSVGILGIILGGWSSNSHYPLLGALRSTAQLVSYEVAMGFAIVGGLMVAGTLSMQGIVLAQREAGMWFIVYQPVAFFVYFVAALAETNRAPFDMPEAESEIVAGYHTEFSGFRFALYFLAEYSNIVIVCCIAVTLFLGGWLRPFANVAAFDFLDYMPVVSLFGIGGLSLLSTSRQRRPMEKIAMAGIGGICILLGLALLGLPVVLDFVKNFFWFTAKVFLAIYSFIWIRFTFPRYRYDQLMSVGWRWLIPISIANVIVTGIIIVLLQ